MVNRDRRRRPSFTPRILTADRGDRRAAGLPTSHRQPTGRTRSPTALLDLVPEDWVVETGGDPRTGQGTQTPRCREARSGRCVRHRHRRRHVTAAFFETLHFCPSCKTSYEAPPSRVLPGRQPRHRGPRQRGDGAVPGRRPRPSASRPRRRGAEVPGVLRQPPGREPAGRALQRLRPRRFGPLRVVPRGARHQSSGTRTSRSPTRTSAGASSSRCRSTRRGLRPQPGRCEYVARKKIARALRESVAYRVWADLSRGWRITMPNLEQTGQLLLVLRRRRGTRRRRHKWAGLRRTPGRRDRRDPAPAHADAARRDAPQHLHRVATTSPRSGTRTSSGPARNGSKAPWALTDEQGVYAATCYPGRAAQGQPGVGRTSTCPGSASTAAGCADPTDSPAARPPAQAVQDADAHHRASAAT